MNLIRAFSLALPLSCAVTACAPVADDLDAGPDSQTDAGSTPDADAGTTPDVDAGTTPDADAGTTPDTDGGTGGSEGPTDEMLRTLAASVTSWFSECLAQGYGDTPLTELEPIYYQQMLEGFGAQSNEDDSYRSLVADAANPRKRFQQSAYDACLSLLEASDCAGGFLDIPEALDEACSSVFAGHQADGEACAEDSECAGYVGDASFCQTPDDGACGVCSPRKGEGEACEWNNACEEGLECDFFTSTCTVVPGPGDACTFSCADGYVCGSEDTCVAPPAEGDDCTPGYIACGGFYAGLSCDETSLKCVPVVAVAVGETCDNDARHCINSFTVNVCSTPTFGEPGVCQARPGNGEACPDYVCAEGFTCDSDGAGTCVATPGIGSACVADECAGDAICDDNNQCVALPAAGEACILGTCGEGLECDDDDVCVANDPSVDVCAMR